MLARPDALLMQVGRFFYFILLLISFVVCWLVGQLPRLTRGGCIFSFTFFNFFFRVFPLSILQKKKSHQGGELEPSLTPSLSETPLISRLHSEEVLCTPTLSHTAHSHTLLGTHDTLSHTQTQTESGERVSV
jgi:hypothetical protein